MNIKIKLLWLTKRLFDPDIIQPINFDLILYGYSFYSSYETLITYLIGKYTSIKCENTRIRILMFLLFWIKKYKNTIFNNNRYNFDLIGNTLEIIVIDC